MNISIVENTELKELETIIDKNMTAFYQVGSALAKIRDSRLYRDTHGTFEEYCRCRWDMGVRHSQRLMLSAGVIKSLQTRPMGRIPINERQTRPLTKLEPDQQIEVWQKVVETAPEGKITAWYVSKIVSETKNENTKREVNKKTLKSKAVIKEEMVDEDFKRAFDAFYWEVQRTRLENWKTTSKKASLRLLSLIQDLIDVN